MKRIAGTVNKHPILLIFYLVYTSLCLRDAVTEWNFNWDMKHHLDVHGQEWGEFDVGFIAVILFFIFGGLAIAHKNETRFYLAMALISVFQPFLFFHIGNMNR